MAKPTTNLKAPVGTATIPLEEWDRMRKLSSESEELIAKTRLALHHVSVLLSFVAKEKPVYDAIQKFNDQSHAAVIHMDKDGKVSVELKDEA